MTALPKPAHRVRVRRPIPRRARPRSLSPAKYGSYRQRIKYANELWRHLIYRKEPCGACPRCLKRRWAEAAHCWTKGGYPWMRFELDNGAPLCHVCHRRVDSDAQAHRDFFLPYIGSVRYAALELRATAHGGKMDLALTIMYLERVTAAAASVEFRAQLFGRDQEAGRG